MLLCETGCFVFTVRSSILLFKIQFLSAISVICLLLNKGIFVIQIKMHILVSLQLFVLVASTVCLQFECPE